MVLLVVLGGFGSFWVVLGRFGWFWVVLGGFGWFRVLVTTYEKLRESNKTSCCFPQGSVRDTCSGRLTKCP